MTHPDTRKGERPVPDSARRRWLQACTGALALAWAGEALPQVASAAAEEAMAPLLPPLGSVLRVPPIALLGGGAFDPAQSRGHFLLIYWWSSTCPFCALQSPSIEAFWRQHRSRGLQILALSVDRKPELASAYLAQKSYTFPSAWASPVWRRDFPKPKGLPVTVLVGRDDRVLLAEKGQMFAEDIEAMAPLMV